VSEADSENKTLSASGGSAAREGLNPEELSSLPRSLLWYVFSLLAASHEEKRYTCLSVGLIGAPDIVILVCLFG
jgi:hypothetical protein